MSEFLKPGAYDQLITVGLASQIEGLPAERVLKEVLQSDDAPEILSRHLQFLFRRAVKSISDTEDPVERIRASNRIIRALAEITGGVVDEDDIICEEDETLLWAIESEKNDLTGYHDLVSPTVRLSESALLVNGRNQPSIGHELKLELLTTDDVDLLCSFVMSTGVNVLESSLKKVKVRGGRIRVLTTTYMGATQKKALDRLVALGAEVRISYDGGTTRLHAKSWLLKRWSGATTAYVGSSNLSQAALVDGIEWNVRISAREQDHIVSTISATFENYWNDKEFEDYDPLRDGDRLVAALKSAGGESAAPITIQFADIEVSPRPYQQEVLDQLEAERQIHHRHHNLVVMATGTGKTIIAGLDFKRLRESGAVKTLLFVAHRQEILQQSLITFRTILRDGSFGELFVDGERPNSWEHVFGSVQSLSHLDFEKQNPDAFDMIIIDEFHHSAASTYEKLLTYFKPKFLLGLTATPERADGQDILHWFGGGISAELRLWEAIDRQILSPFQYFGISDNIDLERAGIAWRRGFGYDKGQLSNLYTGNDVRVALILEQLNHYVDELDHMKALGFCVSIAHAEFMAKKFSDAGIPAKAVTSDVSSEDRHKYLTELRMGALKIIFAVDVFNEGIDIPDVNTLLMLRPTESATVFIQQLGRGLRRSPKKKCLTVLDFVGNQNKNFRFDEKYGKLLGLGRKRLVQAIENGFPYLPTGCHFELDQVSKDQVLENLRTILKFNKGYFASDLRRLGDVGLREYLDSSDAELQDLYKNGRCFTLLKSQVFEPNFEPTQIDNTVAKALGRCLHIDDADRLNAYSRILSSKTLSVNDPYLMMLGYTIFGTKATKENVLEKIETVRGSRVFREILELLTILDEKRTRVTRIPPDSELPLGIHARYSKAEVLPAFGLRLTGAEYGVSFAEEKSADIAFVTLNKNEKHFSPSTMYADTAISESIFQWESQSTASESDGPGKRYVNQRNLGNSFHLFVREFKTDPETGATMPYVYFGPADYISHTGRKPMRIRWRLKYPIPADLLAKAKVIAS